MCEDNKSKSIGLGADPLQRLASFKPPRDLSLGGVKPNKKLFTPNLNVSRNKNRGESSLNNKEQKKDERHRRDRKNDRNKPFNKNGPKVIKSSGVFSEGLGSAERVSSRASHSARDAEPAAALRKPTIRVKDVVKIDAELEEARVRAALGEAEAGGAAAGGAAMDFKRAREHDAPVQLPMYDGELIEKLQAASVKQEVVIKTEPSESDGGAEVRAAVRAAAGDNSEVVELLRAERPALILLQLPDSLPGRGGRADDAPRRGEPASADDQDEQQADARCRLAELPEGALGRLRVHRSGRVTLALGSARLELRAGTRPAAAQTVVSAAWDERSRAARLVALGPLDHKLNLVPHWESLFQDIPT